MDGREKCRALKRLRDDIAGQNGIELNREECTYEGECTGTCPKCEAEAEALSRALERRRIRLSEKPVEIKPDETFELMGEPVDLRAGDMLGPWDNPFGPDDSLWN